MFHWQGKKIFGMRKIAVLCSQMPEHFIFVLIRKLLVRHFYTKLFEPAGKEVLLALEK